VSLAVLHSRALAGLSAPEVTVEVHLANGLPSFTIVGLPDTEVKESRDRVRAALVNSRFEFPARRITVNLAPAELRKESGRFDLPIALGILAASRQIDTEDFPKYEFAGELSLTGELRPVRSSTAPTSIRRGHCSRCARISPAASPWAGRRRRLPSTYRSIRIWRKCSARHRGSGRSKWRPRAATAC
jgi:magnesium chelatase family protein